jgi:Spondin_N
MRVIRRSMLAAGVAALGALVVAPSALAGEREYDVTITDETSGQPLTPPLVATHHGKHAVFDVGQPASVGVREIAENGNSAPLRTFIQSDPLDQFAGLAEAMEPLVPPETPGEEMGFEQSVTLTVEAGRRANRLSWVSMLICTNDGFTGVDGLELPDKVGKATTESTNSYDALTERNTEKYADIVPPCQGLIGDFGDPGTAVSNPALATGGVIAHHAGIQGGADLKPELHGWEDPVATIEVERTS